MGGRGERTIRVERAAAGWTVKETKTGEIRTVRLLEPRARDLAHVVPIHAVPDHRLTEHPRDDREGLVDRRPAHALARQVGPLHGRTVIAASSSPLA